MEGRDNGGEAIPTLLEGEALAAWLDLEEDDQKSYEKAKKCLVKTLMPMGSQPSTDSRRDDYNLGKLCRCLATIFGSSILEQAMPGIGSETRDQLLPNLWRVYPQAIASSWNGH